MGNIITVDNFDSYDDDGNKVFDGSAIVGGIFDRSWFKIKTQDMYMESFVNPNNRTIQYYLNVIRMYNMSLFANGVIFATALPSVAATEVEITEGSTLSLVEGAKATINVKTTPFTANPTLTYTSSATTYATVLKDSGNEKKAVITAVAAGSATITVTDGTHTDTIAVTVNAAA